MKIRRKQREKRTHAVAWLLVVALSCLCFIGFWAVQGALRVTDSWVEDLPSIEDTEFTSTARESVMYASDGTTKLAQFQLEKRYPVESSEVSSYVKQATIDTEDVRFYQHNGVDPIGILRALVNNALGRSREGGSTITMQLVRNTMLTDEATDMSMKRKVREAKLATELEKQYDKDEILLMYLNTVNYGDGCYGIEAAAQNYFQVSASELTIAQAATLAGIPQSPTYLNPKVYPDACLTRRNLVLDRMLSAGDITQEEHDAAQTEPLGLNPADEAPEDGIYAYPYFTSYVRNQLMETDNPYGCKYADLFEGGLTIYTTLDTTMQNQAEAACAAQRARMSSDLDCALVAVDATTGQVKAMVGGSDYSSSQVNLATGAGGSGRQAGSTFKAFTLAAAIEKGINPLTRIDCSSPMTKQINGQDQTFENFDNANYGIRTIQSATAVSANTGYLRLSEEIGQAATTEMAKRLGVESDMSTVYTSTLGVASVTPLDMASSYATIANGGTKHDTIAITKIVDSNGNVIYEAKQEGTRVLSEEVAGATTSVLKQVFEATDGTASSAKPENGQEVAGKTGTSTDFADHWLVGYTPTLSVATWIGNPSGSIKTDTSLNCNALWKDFMDRALSGVEVKKFPKTSKPTYNNTFNDKQKALYGAEAEVEAQSQTPTRIGQGTTLAKDGRTAPDVVGKTLTEATSTLSSWKAGYITEASTTVAKDTVIRQYNDSDGMVVIVVSSGTNSATSTSATTTSGSASTGTSSATTTTTVVSTT